MIILSKFSIEQRCGEWMFSVGGRWHPIGGDFCKMIRSAAIRGACHKGVRNA